ncbi:MAG: hypothetical protein AB1646_10995 [Thermodesulfobacteriota bacterium]
MGHGGAVPPQVELDKASVKIGPDGHRRTKGVLVLHPDGSETLLTDSGTLDGQDVLPCFAIPIADLFEGLDY